MQEVGSVVTAVKDLTNDNNELRQTFEKTSKDFDGFRKSTNFRLNLYSSKEYKQIDQFF